jgi:CHAT domain-containing protein
MLQSIRPPKPMAQGLLLFGDAISPGGEYPPLPQARVEVEQVQAHFPAEKRVVIAGENATPAAYLQNRPERFRYVHFVTHGAASRLQPLDSGVILSRDGNGSYKLYARDIMRQPLQAELVTVSACYGAGTRTYSGEGLVGLSWSFLRAGAHHVIASLWEVNDASTPQLMDDLYGELTKGRDPVMALHNAKIAMLRSGSVYRRPFYWGAFQVYLGS